MALFSPFNKFFNRIKESSDTVQSRIMEPTEIPKKPLWKRASNWFRSTFSSKHGATDGEPNINKPEDENEKQGLPPEFRDIPIVVETEALLAPGIENFIRGRGADFWRIGFNDGVKGINKSTIWEIAKGQALTLIEWIRSNSHGKLKALKSDKKVKEKIMHDEEDRYNDAVNHLDEMTHLYHKHPRSFSWLLFGLYFSIAIFLVIADVPLAKILTEKGFDLEVGSIASWLLTLGIAFCAIYVKIFYDDYIATANGHFIVQFKKIPSIIGDRIQRRIPGDDAQEKNKSISAKRDIDANQKATETSEVENTQIRDELLQGQEANTEQQKKEILVSKVEYWIKFIVKTIILIVTLRTIWVLGEFRYQNISNPERDIIMEYVGWVVEKMGKNPAEVTEHAFNITLLAFRMITLIFPIIGGVCLSLAMTNLQNNFRLIAAKRSFKQYQRHFLAARDEYNKVAKDYEDYQGIFDEWKKQEPEEHAQRYGQIFNSFYLLGYQRGERVPDFFTPTANLYQQVESLRRKLVARRTQKILEVENA